MNWSLKLNEKQIREKSLRGAHTHLKLRALNLV